MYSSTQGEFNLCSGFHQNNYIMGVIADTGVGCQIIYKTKYNCPNDMIQIPMLLHYMLCTNYMYIVPAKDAVSFWLLQEVFCQKRVVYRSCILLSVLSHNCQVMMRFQWILFNDTTSMQERS